MDKIIGFIGTGNMGSALVKAVSKSYNPENIYLSNKPEVVEEEKRGLFGFGKKKKEEKPAEEEKAAE